MTKIDAVPVGADWTHAEAYDAVLKGGRAALAWELLRRDPAYRDAAQPVGVGQVASSKFVTRWGLHFR